jgi:hypothetical protein
METGFDVMDARLTFLIVLLALVIIGGVKSCAHSAEQPRQPYTACDVDRIRYCPSLSGIPTILACLQQHRSVLSKPCAQLLQENGK